MMGKITAVLLSLASLMFIISCAVSGSVDFPQGPPITMDSPLTLQSAEELATSDAGKANHYLWGYYLFYVDPVKNIIEPIPLKNATAHWNVLKFLEKGPCSNCVSVVKVTPNPSGTKSFDVKIKHPFQSLNLTGFDVCGIAMFKGSHSFPVSALSTPDSASGDGELVNPDGYTTLYNINTVGNGPGGLQGYLKGKFAGSSAPNAGLNGYKRYITDNPANVRNAFYGGDEITETFEIRMPTSGFILGYAVDASWVPPTIKPVTNPMDDFSLEANCSEPWKLVVTEFPVDEGLTTNGGATVLVVDVYDWQGPSSHEAPLLECGELFDGTLPATWQQDYAGYSEWMVYISNDKLAPVGDYKCLIKVVDNDNAGSPAWLDLTAYQIQKLSVTQTASCWARTWGQSGSDNMRSVAADSSGNICVIADFENTVDLNPGPGVDEHTSNGSFDVSLSKFDPSGNFLWGVSWGGLEPDTSNSVAVDQTDGSIYVGGGFAGTSDFDPGPGVFEVTSNASDAFLLKLNELGGFVWVRTWGSTGYEDVKSIDVDQVGNIDVAGYFQNTVDFDPGPGVASRICNGDFDTFLSQFDSSGNFNWVDSFGGPNDDVGFGVATAPSGVIYLAGRFENTVDFNPGSGTDNHTVLGQDDAFLVQLNSVDGSFGWARTWGGLEWEEALAVDADSSGNVAVGGQFMGTCDFNPDPVGEDIHVANGEFDAFLNVFDSSGNQQFARTWGGVQSDVAVGIRYYEDKSIPEARVAVTGWFYKTADFDTGATTDNRVSNGGSDVFLTSFNQYGAWMYAVTWGGPNQDSGIAVTSFDNSDSLYVVGYYYETVDFNPGVGVDNHTSNGEYDNFLVRLNNAGSW
jgi:hypothetical protein